jgi:hypothetical protein
MLELLAGIIVVSLSLGLVIGIAGRLGLLIADTVHHLGLGIAALFALTGLFLEGAFRVGCSLLRLSWRSTGADWLSRRIARELVESRAGVFTKRALASRVGVVIVTFATKRLTPRAIGRFLGHVLIGPPYPARTAQPGVVVPPTGSARSPL